MLDAEVATVDGKHWARFKASSVPAILPPEPPAEMASTEAQPAAEGEAQAEVAETSEGGDKELAEQLAANAEDQAATLNAKVTPWVYELTAYAAGRLRTPLDKLEKAPEGS